MDRGLLTPHQVAERLHVTERTVYRWLTTGRLRAVRLGRLWRIPPEELEAFLREKGRPEAGATSYRTPREEAGADRVREGAVRKAEVGAGLEDEDWVWLQAGAEDQARALAAAEGEIPPRELAEYLSEVGSKAIPVRWNPSRQAFEEVRP